MVRTLRVSVSGLQGAGCGERNVPLEVDWCAGAVRTLVELEVDLPVERSASASTDGRRVLRGEALRRADARRLLGVGEGAGDRFARGDADVVNSAGVVSVGTRAGRVGQVPAVWKRHGLRRVVCAGLHDGFLGCGRVREVEALVDGVRPAGEREREALRVA